MPGVWRNSAEQSAGCADPPSSSEAPVHQRGQTPRAISQSSQTSLPASLSPSSGSPEMSVPPDHPFPSQPATVCPMPTPSRPLCPLLPLPSGSLPTLPPTAGPPSGPQPTAPLSAPLRRQLLPPLARGLLQGDGEAEEEGVQDKVQVHSGVVEARLHQGGLPLLRVRSTTGDPPTTQPAGQQLPGRLPDAWMLAAVVPPVHAL